jgi:hypothetical protein
MIEQPRDERSRSPYPALVFGTAAAVAAGSVAWAGFFGVGAIPVPGWEGDLVHTMQQSLDVVGKSARTCFDALPPDIWRPMGEACAPRTLLSDATMHQVGGRALAALAAGVAFAWPLSQWRYERTPRRFKAEWVNSKIAKWSEGADAVRNANLHMAASAARTGRGLEIAPKVPLSCEKEARAFLIVGDPGGGKTIAFWTFIWQLLRRGSRLVVHDVKGDMVERWPERFLLLAPHDARSLAWDIGRDLVGEIRVREWAAALIVKSDRSPQWGSGAREILVGLVLSLQHDFGTNWGWGQLKAALDLPDAELREFATRHNPASARFLALDETGNFTLNAGSYVSTVTAPANEIVAPLARAWGGLAPEFRVSLRAWLDDPQPSSPTLILQRAADLPEISKIWIGAVIDVMTSHLLASRRDANPADGVGPQRDTWFVIDEFGQLNLNLKRFMPILETGRSLQLRAIFGLQNFSQLGDGAPSSANLATQLRQLAGVWLAFHLDPGPDAKIVAEERVTKGKIRVWENDDKTGEKKPASKEVPILAQEDLAELRITRDGPEGYLLLDNTAFRLQWPFPQTPKQREGTVKSDRFYE